MDNTAYELALDAATNKKYSQKALNYHLRDKGFGDREQELSYLANFFKKVFENYTELKSFQWSQYQDFDDNYLYFEITNYQINDRYVIDIYSFNNWPRSNWNFSFNLLDENKEQNIEKFEKRFKKLQKELHHLKQPIIILIFFLKSLYDFYGPYYYIYVFGRRATVKITGKGINIKTDKAYSIKGDKFDKIFNNT